jgi:hypothetical protein
MRPPAVWLCLREFNLLRWFSVISLLIIASVAGGLGYVSTRFVVRDSVQRDAMLTAQFIQAMAQAEVRHSQLPPGTTMGELLDPRLDQQHLQFTPAGRVDPGRVPDHVEHLPDTLLANVYARDRTIVWSTNVELIGKRIEADGDLERAFRSRKAVSASYHKAEEDREEQKFEREPRYLFIENYIPLFDSQGEQVLAMVEIYKEPQDLVRRIQRGYVLIWASTLVGGALIYFGLFWIVRRAAHAAPAAGSPGGERNLRGPWRDVLGVGPQPAQPAGQHPLQRRAGPGNRQPGGAEEHHRHHQPGRPHVALGTRPAGVVAPGQ